MSSQSQNNLQLPSYEQSCSQREPQQKLPDGTMFKKSISREGDRRYDICFPNRRTAQTTASKRDGGIAVCISTESNCSRDCIFCAAGRTTNTAPLSTENMLFQINLAERDFGCACTKLLLTGRGEPFKNFTEVQRLLNAVTESPSNINLSNNRTKLKDTAIEISTSGDPSDIERMTDNGRAFALAVSINACRQEVRNILMPSMDDISLTDIKAALDRNARVFKRAVFLDFVMIDGLNDNEIDTQAMVDYCQDLLCTVRLYRLNQNCKLPFHSSPAERIRNIADTMNAAKIDTIAMLPT